MTVRPTSIGRWILLGDHAHGDHMEGDKANCLAEADVQKAMYHAVVAEQEKTSVRR